MNYYELHEQPLDGKTDISWKAWQKEQMRRLWVLICMAFTGEKGTGKLWRMLTCYRILRKRLKGIRACNWDSMIAGFSDIQAVGEVRMPVLREDLCRIRNMALYSCQMRNRKVV